MSTNIILIPERIKTTCAAGLKLWLAESNEAIKDEEFKGNKGRPLYKLLIWENELLKAELKIKGDTKR